SGRTSVQRRLFAHPTPQPSSANADSVCGRPFLDAPHWRRTRLRNDRIQVTRRDEQVPHHLANPSRIEFTHGDRPDRLQVRRGQPPTVAARYCTTTAVRSFSISVRVRTVPPRRFACARALAMNVDGLDSKSSPCTSSHGSPSRT